MKKKFFDIAIFWQLILAISVVVVLCTFASLVGLIGMANTKNLLQELYQGNVKVVLKQSELDGLYTVHQLTVMQHLGSEWAKDMQDYKQLAQKTENQIQKMINSKSHSSRYSGDVTPILKDLTREYFDIAHNIIYLSGEFEKEDASRIMRSDLRNILMQINLTAKQVVSRETIHMDKFYDEAVRLQKKNSTLAWIFIIATFLLSILFAYFIAKIITYRLKILVNCAESLGKGEFAVRVDLKSDDEFGELAKSINMMAYKLDTMFNELNGTYRELEEKHTSLSHASELEQSRLANASLTLKTIMQKVVNEKDTSIRCVNSNLHPCWEQKKCPNKDCAAYGSVEQLRCWEVNNTLCALPLKHYNTIAEKIKKCRDCVVYKNARNDSISTILETFNEMMAILDEKMKELSESQRLAEQSSNAKSQFMANMSHEIRTPMNGIMGFTELLLNMTQPSEQKNYLKFIQNSSERLMVLINDILDFSKIEALKFELDVIEFNLHNLLNDCMKLLAVTAAEKELELILSINYTLPTHLNGDPGRLRQILLNLVGNAIKFTDHGEIVVSVDFYSEGNHASQIKKDDQVMLIFSVKDTGIGIPVDSQKTIFDLFTQADGSTTRKYGGTGLGLTISTRLIDMMGGEIWLESELQKGTTFNFTACFDKIYDDTSFLFPLACQELSEMSVLIVDDNLTNLQVLSEMLRDFIKESELADSGQIALDKMQSKQFDLLIIDSRMPRMDGVTLAKRIKANFETCSTPIILLTSAGQAGDASLCIENGINDSLMKPVILPELIQTMMKIVSGDKKIVVTDPPLVTRSLPDETSPKLRVLLVDDELINQTLGLALLENNNYQVTVASNGEEALNIYQKNDFDFIMMDIQMPVMDGVEATCAIREIEKETGDHIAIIAVTAHAMKGDKEKFLNIGMDDYISKPIQIDKLMEKINRLPVPRGVNK